MLGVILLFLFSPSASAAEFSCVTFDKLYAGTQTCADNHYFVEAGRKCFQDLQARISAGTAALQVKMAASQVKNIVEPGARQSGDMKGTSEDYQASALALEALLRDAAVAKAQIEIYTNRVYFPNGIDSVVDAGDNVQQFLDSHPCFADAEKRLKGTLAKVNRAIQSLQTAKTASAALRKSSGKKLESLSGSVSAKTVKSTRGQGSGAIPVGTDSNVQSDITGTKKEPENK